MKSVIEVSLNRASGNPRARLLRNKGQVIFWSWQAVVAFVMAAALLAGPTPVFGQAKILEVHDKLADYDSRTNKVAPTPAQMAAVTDLGATVRWNEFGTPKSLIKYGGYLATGQSGDAVTIARNWILANRTLFRLSDQSVGKLELLNDSKMANSDSHAVMFRQSFAGLPAAQDGMIIVGVAGDKIAYVSSSAIGDQPAPQEPVLSATSAWLAAAASINHSVAPLDITNLRQEHSWALFNVTGLSHPQRARLVAFAIPGGGVRPAFETIFLNVQGGDATAYKFIVDAASGQVLFRQNAVQQAAAMFAPQTTPFQGTYQDDPAPQMCGPFHDFAVPAGTVSIDVVASAAIVSNDIVVELLFNNVVVASSDTATSPEAIHYEPAVLVPGTYRVRVCPFGSPTAPPAPPYSYAGTFTTNDTAGTSNFPYPPKWKVFPANPSIDLANTDTRKTWCWQSTVNGAPVAGCEFQLQNLAARAPWDHNTRTNQPTFTTLGNAANAAESWGSPLTPSEPYRPVASNRVYNFPWTNQWKESGASQTVFGSPQRNDIDAAIVNLFAMHNRMHDWSYFLGFTENNFNMQDSNFGNTAPGPYPNGRENDPEVGNAQAGAVSGGAPSYLGRDNANQITLNDGIAPITNMYLWQPIAAAFYPPLVDGDYDMSIIGHEYTHAISNRMVGGPDANLTGRQAGSMGESWSDLNAVEILSEYGFSPTNDENPFSVGAYATGHKEKGIRNYALNVNPLNYSNIGHDFPGPEVHSDGEVWNAVNFEIRQVLIDKYNAQFPAANAALQRDCADGKIAAGQCPGNRRWIQIVYDAWLLMQPGVSMLDARDAYLAADMMRFGGANQIELWQTFARRGMGVSATSNGSDDGDPVPAFDAPVGPAEANVTFAITNSANAAIPAKVYIGLYEQGSNPVADTITGTPLGNSLQIVPGSYDILVQASGYGMHRYRLGFGPGQNTTVTLKLPTNHASMQNGATVTASSTASAGAGDAAINAIDDTEATNWSGTGQLAADQTLTIDLAGSTPVTLKYVNISAMLHTGQNRFTALRKFRLEASTDGTNFSPIFISSDHAFPGEAPRPAAPDVIIRTFTFAPLSATHLRLIADTNQCQGGPDFQGDQDADPSNNGDCTTGNPTQGGLVRVTEVEAFGDCPGTPFVDVPSGHPFEIEVCRMAARGITVGCAVSPALYCPDSPTTRAQMAIFLARALGAYNPQTPTSQRFADTPPSHFAYVFIEEVARRGIITTCAGGNFCPDQPITREEMAIWIIRALGEFNPPVPASQRFNDVPPARPGYAFIEEMFLRGITFGCSATPPLYCPDATVTRGQMAAFLSRAFNL
jgi:extracellular elastinolytic metalloproteinase